MLAKCIRRCWDSKLTKRYFPGMLEELSEDHVFLTGPIKCFVKVDPKDLARSQDAVSSQLRQQAEVIASLSKKLDDLESPGAKLIDEEKRGPGRPRKEA